MHNKHVIDLTEPKFNAESEFLEAAFSKKPSTDHIDIAKSKQQLDLMLKKTNGNPDTIELELQAPTKAKPVHPWQAHGKTQSLIKPTTQAKLPPGMFAPVVPGPDRIRLTPKPIAANLAKDRSYLKHTVELHHAPSFAVKGKFNEKGHMEEGWNDLMRLKSILPKKNVEEEFLPKKRERPIEDTAKTTLSNFLKQRKAENLAAEKRKQLKRTDTTQSEIERQLASGRAMSYECMMQEDARKFRYSQRLDLRDLNEFLLTLTVDKLEKPATDLRPIPDSFEDGNAYIRHMQPALFEEVRADLVSSLNQMSYGRASLVKLSIFSSKENLSFLNVVDDVDKKRPLFQAAFRSDDFVLIVPKTSQTLSDWRGSDSYFFAVCEHLYDGDRRVSPLIYLKVAQTNSLTLSSKADYYVVWVESLITILREFKMIRMAEFIDMTPYIFTPSCRRIPHKLSIPSSFFQFLQASFNDSQVKAIEEACNIHSGVTLIQGPPGTGKTHTILGIISAFMLSTGYAANRPRVLVCAPSNAAIDELARRVVLQGLYNEYGDKRTDISCIRLGSWTKEQLILKARKTPTKQDPPPEVQSISLNNLVAERLKMQDITDPSIEIERMRKEVLQIQQEMDDAKKVHQQAKIETLILKRRNLENRIYREKLAKNSHEDNRKTTVQELLTRADIVFTTLSGAFSKDMELTGGGWNFVIIDEACQALELATLIPMQYDAKITVLIGDPKQLPGTTFSHQSARNSYDRSLFERMMTAGCPVTMLEVQYRMAPSIRSFPSLFFYQNKLRDALEVINREQPYWLPELPFAFIDLLTSREMREGGETSIKNHAEAELIANLYLHYKAFHGTSLDIGVITPYKSQVFAIKRALESKCGQGYKKDVEVNTVDGFQGREKAVIIFSCVRSGDNIGFLSDQRRLNVAITRAKYALWVVGSAECLSRQGVWKDFISFAIEDNLLIKAKHKADISSQFVVKQPISLARIPVTAPRPESEASSRRFVMPAVPERPKEPQPTPSNPPSTKATPVQPQAPPANKDYLSDLLHRMKEQQRRA